MAEFLPGSTDFGCCHGHCRSCLKALYKHSRRVLFQLNTEPIYRGGLNVKDRDLI
ncbi:hypothetical Protein YC6258_05063 [Gynuella sunshinyii YC6258]|uniref:Uncharacterized protein n=1 Tax=Gynuella sunshinyii YC6258 TaxID=1445510 RepID=A0A0C5VUW4_9GAMM|nr:hypothetical Protein YC6258_05063 [Gynuella sunshinyii YC6258]